MSNKPKTRVQKFEAWWQENKLNPHMSYRIAWMAGYLAGYRARQYEGDQRGRVQRADHPERHHQPNEQCPHGVSGKCVECVADWQAKHLDGFPYG